MLIENQEVEHSRGHMALFSIFSPKKSIIAHNLPQYSLIFPAFQYAFR